MSKSTKPGRAVGRRGFLTGVAPALAIAVLASVLTTATPLFAQASDSILGTSVLDRTKSVFSENVPEERTMTFEKVANGSRHTTETQRAEAK